MWHRWGGGCHRSASVLGRQRRSLSSTSAPLFVLNGSNVKCGPPLTQAMRAPLRRAVWSPIDECARAPMGPVGVGHISAMRAHVGPSPLMCPPSHAGPVGPGHIDLRHVRPVDVGDQLLGRWSPIMWATSTWAVWPPVDDRSHVRGPSSMWATVIDDDPVRGGPNSARIQFGRTQFRADPIRGYPIWADTIRVGSKSGGSNSG